MESAKNIKVFTALKDENKIDSATLEAYGLTVLGECNTASGTVKAVLQLQPDVLLCDSFLQEGDALEILEQLRLAKYSGVIIAFLDFPAGTFKSTLLQSGIDYYLVRPFELDFLVDRIRALHQAGLKVKTHNTFPPQISDHFDLENQVSSVMHQIGIPAHIRGHRYIRSAVIMALENADILNAITKELYPGIAAIHHTTASRVERAIRHAIEVAFTRGDIETLNAMFGYTIKTSKGKPTNSEFISMLADRMRMTLKIG